ncbi:HAD hydrolase-like protein [Streptomyces cinnabarinus]|uniref:HAD hydrolase-like protein n=1 Tax=Streptomyces cinnabarinus TaxID=67287 RepID=A0ABY7KU27_9ACTN|nr:HAD hydrolase-like protein [Streptomyces cinnabarinus]WAZ26602.1 HAD hydrolase-like protein [Streptomyces cinnabarinus]
MAIYFDGQRLRTERERAKGGRGMSAAQLAACINAKTYEIVAYEQGATCPEPERIRRLAKALGIAPLCLAETARRDRWNLADLRRLSGWTAREISEELRLSPRSYRRFETEGLLPAHRRALVAEVAALLHVSPDTVEELVGRSPRVRERLNEVRQPLTCLVTDFLQPQRLGEPDPSDPQVIRVAGLYHRSSVTVARILSHEIAALRDLHRRRVSFSAAADYAPSMEERNRAERQVEAETQRISDLRVSLPRRLDLFFRHMISQDAWRALSLLNEAKTLGRWWSHEALGMHEGFDSIPDHFLQTRRSLSGEFRVSQQGAQHCSDFGSWYGACYPSATAFVTAQVSMLAGHMPDRHLNAVLAASDALVFSFDSLLSRLFAATLETVSRKLLLAARELDLPTNMTMPADPVGMLRVFVRHASGSQARQLGYFLQIYEIEAARRAHPLPGISELLETLSGSGWRLAIVTDHSDVAVKMFLDRLWLDGSAQNIKVIGRPDNPLRMKPHPHNLVRAADVLKTSCERMVLVGESATDAEAAHRAGLSFIGVATGHRLRLLRETGAETVPSLRTIVDVIRSGPCRAS